MPPPFVEGCRRIVVSGQLSTLERWSNTFHVFDESPLTQARTNSYAAAAGNLYAGILDRQSSQWTVDTVTSYDLSEEFGPSFTTGDLSEQGTNATTCFQQIANVITWRTGLPGRRFRGRTYWCGLGNVAYVEVGVDGPLMLDTTPAVALANAAEAMREAFLTLLAPMVVFSRIAPGVLSEIETLAVGTVPDTQRRRRDQLVEVYVSPTG